MERQKIILIPVVFEYEKGEFCWMGLDGLTDVLIPSVAGRLAGHRYTAHTPNTTLQNNEIHTVQ